MNKLIIPFVLIAFLLISACQDSEFTLKNGVWRGVLQTDSTIDIPFNFEVYDSAGIK